MATGNSVYDEIREQHQHMKDKTPKEKLSYFWDYYRIPTLVAIVAILLIGNLIYTVVTQKDEALNVVFVNTFVREDVDIEQLEEDFLTYAGIDAKKYQALISTNMFVDYETMDEYSIANTQKIMVETASSSLDVIVADEAYLENNLDSGLFGDLSELLPAELLAEFEDRLLYLDIPEDGKGEIPVAIDISDYSLMASDQLEAYFCVTSNTTHSEQVAQFLTYLKSL